MTWPPGHAPGDGQRGARGGPATIAAVLAVGIIGAAPPVAS
jgi:hypothetical protein